jgi:hypothetical protein
MVRFHFRFVRTIRLGLVAGLSVVFGLVCAGSASALTPAPRWQLGVESVPTNLPPVGKGQLVVVASDLGDAAVQSKTMTTLMVKLPAGVSAVSVEPLAVDGVLATCSTAPALQCAVAAVLNPYEQFRMIINVKDEQPSGAPLTLDAQATVEGGGASVVSRTLPIPVSGQPAGFGVAGYEVTPENEDGTPDTQSGEHPFQLTTTLTLNQLAEPRNPVELPRDLSFHLPPGLVGNPNAAAQCTMADFFALVTETNLCKPASVVGVATVYAHEPIAHLIPKTVPVFNLVPAQGEPARLGFEVFGKIPVVIDTAVRSGTDYGVNATVENATELAGLLSSQVSLWGVPGDARHNNARGWECVAGGQFVYQVGKPCPVNSAEPEEPFLTLPTACAADPRSEPVRFPMQTDSWAHPGLFVDGEYEWTGGGEQLLGFQGCDRLPFSPGIDVLPEEHTASTPTGLDVDVRVPQQTTLEADGLAEADVRDTTVTLPEGVELSPSAANGLEACSEDEVGFTGFNQATQTNEFNTAKVSCPDGSKVGTVRIKTPLLSHELEGNVYLASPAPNGGIVEPGRNPFGSLVALYIVAEDPISGVLVKLAGEGQVDEHTLRVATTFRNTPQVPFEELQLHLFGGERASLTTPALCGAYATDGLFTPWSGTEPAVVQSSASHFEVVQGVGGSSCPAGVPFDPGFRVGSGDTQAGAFTSFNLELTRPDGDQALSGVSVRLPAGIAALLSKVQLCSEAQASTNSCPADSKVGEALAVAGLGSEPFVQGGGQVYITGPYHGAPFGLSIVTPAKAGPFDLGYVTVRSRLLIDEHNASVTVVSDPLPTQIRGIPLQLKRVIVNVNRPEFEFNPTSCNPMSIEGTITGDQGASQSVSSRFQVGGCEHLAFTPKFTASTNGHASKANGASFVVKVQSGGVNATGVAQANIARVDLQLPKALPARLTTLQKACTEAAFNANPASCPEGSNIGTATIHTPVLANPLSGPAYLVSHGGAAFPDVEFVLQGEGIKLILDGQTQIKNGITYSKFDSAPDAPFTTFETTLPMGPHSALTSNVPANAKFSLCGTSLPMPTKITAQTGAVTEQATKIVVQGCGAVKAAHTRKLTRQQKLTLALKACRKQHRRSHAKRQACERQAHKKYGPLPKHKAKHAGNRTKKR